MLQCACAAELIVWGAARASVDKATQRSSCFDFLEALRLEAIVFLASLGVGLRPCGGNCSPQLSSTRESAGSLLPSGARSLRALLEGVSK